MKVKELIEELEKADENLDILLMQEDPVGLCYYCSSNRWLTGKTDTSGKGGKVVYFVIYTG